jgi:hypothetical protein
VSAYTSSNSRKQLQKGHVSNVLHVADTASRKLLKRNDANADADAYASAVFATSEVTLVCDALCSEQSQITHYCMFIATAYYCGSST